MGIKKFVCSSKYRREVIFRVPGKGFGKKLESEKVKKRAADAQMQLDSGKYISKIKDFPTTESVEKLKNFVDGVEIQLRGGGIVSDYSGAVKGGLHAWDATKTAAQSGNVIVEGALGTQALGDAIVEWNKGHYFCCVCSGVACSCFFVAAAASLIPGGYGVWKVATKAGVVTKGVTGVCRKVTGGGI